MTRNQRLQLKDALYAQFARIGHAVSTPKRIEIIDLLSQADRSVAEVAELTHTPLKNTSAHLRALREAGLVDTRRDGQRIVYRLADERVGAFVRQLQDLSRARLAEVERVVQLFFEGCDELEIISAHELDRRMRAGDVTVIDVRPLEEYEAGHLPGAISVPLEQLKRRGDAGKLPRSREVVAYCRGRYCLWAAQAATLLNDRGYRALRYEGGLPGWRETGRRVTRRR